MYKKLALALVFLISTYILKAAGADSLSVIDYSKPTEYVIDTIVISGVKYLDQRVLVNMSGLAAGSKITVPGDAISNTIRKFWEHGLFEDVKISVLLIEGKKVKLDIYLKERPRISRFNIEGVSKSDRDDLKEKLNIRAGSQVTENVINDAILVVKKFYIEKGFFNVKVDVNQQIDTLRHNSVVLTLQIAKNKRVKIHSIYFNGNEEISDEKLRKAMKKTKQRDWKFWNSSKYIESDFREDKSLVVDYFNEKGYRDAKILTDSFQVVYPYGDWYINDSWELDYRVLYKLTPDTTIKIKKNRNWYFSKFMLRKNVRIDTIVKIQPAKRINLHLSLYEGQKYYFRNISWIGNTKYPGEYLSAVLGINSGDIFDQKILDKRLQNDDDAVASLYLDNGYLFFNVMPVEVKIDNDSIDFEMRMYEGTQATISNVLISGNTKTNEHVVRRELRTMPGELFSKSDIVRSVRELATLGHFEPERIQPVPIPKPENSTVDIEFKLAERANDQLEVSGGWGGYYKFIGTVGIRFSNFSYKNFFNWKEWRPVPSGDGQTLSMRFQTNGTIYRSFMTTFADPWFGGKKPNSLSVSAYMNRISNEGNPFAPVLSRMNTYGITAGLGRRLRWPDDYFTLQNAVTFDYYDLKNYGTMLGLAFNDGTLRNLNYSITFGRNSLDQFIYPRTGSNLSLKLQITPPWSLLRSGNIETMSENEKYKWVEYHKWVFKSETYTSLVGNLVLMTRANFGLLGKYNDKLNYSPLEKFEVGGSGMSSYAYFNVDIVPMRGYEDRSISMQPNGNYYTNCYNKFSLEVRYPVTLKEQATIFGLAFLEAGNSWYEIKSFNPFDVKRAAGFGVRVFLPMFGLLGFDIGYGFDKVYNGENYAKPGWVPQFTMGQQF